MTTFNTGNPIGSAAAKDLYDNAENLDEFVNSDNKLSHPDRLGVERKTWHGMEQDFQAFLANSGYIGTGVGGAIEDYAAGIEITAYNQVIRDGGELWRLSAGTSLPYTTTGAGMPEGGSFVSVGDAVLRQELAAGTAEISSSTGTQAVSEALDQRVIYVDSLADLQGLLTSELLDGQQVIVKDDGVYAWNASTSQFDQTEFSKDQINAFASSAAEQAANIDNLIGNGGVTIESGALVTDDPVIRLGRGAYSWWSFPQSLQTTDPVQKTITGVVNDDYTTCVETKGSSSTNISTTAYVSGKNQYATDEHNGPVPVEAGGHLVVFYPGHGDVGYLPYKVSKTKSVDDLGDEKQIPVNSGALTYAQVFYTDNIGGQSPRLWVFTRANSSSGGVSRGWYCCWSEDWDSASPTWTIELFVDDTDQLYLKVIPRIDGITNFRFLLHKNATLSPNGIWFGYLNPSTGGIFAEAGNQVGTLGTDVIQLSGFEKIYTPDPGGTERVRIFDAGVGADVLILFSSGFGGVPWTGDYKFAKYNVGTNTLEYVTTIAPMGEAIDGQSYFGGGSFSTSSTERLLPAGYSVFLARESTGSWILEEYSTNDDGQTFTQVRTVDSSDSEKIFRPTVPVNTRTRSRFPGDQIKLVWCKGSWDTYTDFDADLWALIE